MSTQDFSVQLVAVAAPHSLDKAAEMVVAGDGQMKLSMESRRWLLPDYAVLGNKCAVARAEFGRKTAFDAFRSLLQTIPTSA